MTQANAFFGPGWRPPKRRRGGDASPAASDSSACRAQADGGHYTLITVETNQPGESEADKLAKRFLTLVHTLAEPSHEARGAY